MKKSVKSTKQKIVTFAVDVAKKSVSESNVWGWPPNCVGIFYQSKRPSKLRKENAD